jgi:small GTP-binding protein
MAHSTAAVAPTGGVREHLIELRVLARELLPADSLADLADAIARLDHVRCNVAVLGEFKRGKSTLVNALVEHAVLPTDVLPLTSAITVVRHGPRHRLVVGYADGDDEERPFADLAALVTDAGDPAGRDDVVSVAVELPDELLARGIQIVDTPGIGSIHAHNTTTTERFLGRVDIALCVLAADQPLNQRERDLIAAVVEGGARPLFAINKIDLIDTADRDRTQRFVTKGVRGLTGPNPEVIALSARTAEGVSQLRDRLFEIADVDLGSVISQAGAARGAAMARDAAMAARVQAAALRLPLAELSARASELDQRLTELEHANQDARDLLARGVERTLRTRVDEPLTRLAKDRRSSLSEQLVHAAAAEDGGPRKLAAALDAWIDEYTREGFDALARRYEHVISDELRMLQSRHAARVAEILDGVRAAAQAGLDTDLASFPVAAGLRRPPAFSFKLDDPADALEDVVASTRSLLPGTVGRRLVIRAAQERLLAMTDRHAGRLRAALVDGVREATREYDDELDAAVVAACAAIRVAIARAEGDHATQQRPTEAQLCRLAMVEARCRELAAALTASRAGAT